MTTPQDPASPRPTSTDSDSTDSDRIDSDRIDSDRIDSDAARGAARANEGDVLDTSTFHGIPEPRGSARLPLGDGTWHQLARAYLWVRIISGVVGLVVIALAAGAAWFVIGPAWWWMLAAAVLLVITVVSLAVTPRQVRAFGYQLRDDDLVMRRGILWQRVVAVPYGRMQLVDITHGPLDRMLGIAQLKLVTAAATSGVVLPGLTQEAAERLRDTLIDVAETRRTGL